MRSKVAILRDFSIGLAGIIALISQIRAENGFLAALAILLAGVWVFSARSRLLPQGLVSQIAFLGIAALLAVRLSDLLLPLNITGMWFLVCAMDIERLHLFFPGESSVVAQTLLIRRRLLHLGGVGTVTALITVLARLVALPLRLSAVLLVGVFVVVVVVQLIRQVADTTATE